MTDSQTLLAEYAESSSESAFRELVTRYIGLVYATALRLVEGDTHLAEDVAQTVFVDLARKARGLSRAVMLGGWLHQRTFNVAAPMMRAARRRQAREREAVQMNAMPDDPTADLEQIAPMLDEALTKLGQEDRTAIILRFFERRDFRSIGTALGSNEDAARMRVTRALEKLHILLKHRGVTLSAAALGAALSVEAATAAPVGLAASIAGAALAGSAAGGGIVATLHTIGIMTKLKAGIISAVAIAGVTATLVVQQQARARLRAQDESLRQQSDREAQLVADNERLANVVARGNGSKDQSAELAKLRGEAESLRQQTNDLALLREANRRLQQRPEAKPKTPLQMTEAKRAKMTFGHLWVAAFRDYAEKNGDLFPTSFEQAASFIPAKDKAEANLIADHFEIVYQGSVVMPNGGEVVVLREKEPWQDSDGKWCKVYGLADGSSQVVAMPSRWTVGGKQISYDTFEAFEKDHIIPPPGK
jgi:RNA polymerase sigma factor (sigma-70 family)